MNFPGVFHLAANLGKRSVSSETFGAAVDKKRENSGRSNAVESTNWKPEREVHNILNANLESKI